LIDREVTVYVFRDSVVSGSAETVVSVAAQDDVIDCFGLDSLASDFGGYVIYRDDEAGRKYVGVWGARHASKFRSALRKHFASVSTLHERPHARRAVVHQKR
jgi:hypothetical protein